VEDHDHWTRCEHRARTMVEKNSGAVNASAL
jgi:hypothetical protein